MSIIRQIYNGDYRPADQEPEESPEHQAARERAYREYQALRDKLPIEPEAGAGSAHRCAPGGVTIRV